MQEIGEKNWSLGKTVGPKKNFTASCHYDMRKIIRFEGGGLSESYVMVKWGFRNL